MSGHSEGSEGGGLGEAVLKLVLVVFAIVGVFFIIAVIGGVLTGVH